MDEHVDRAALGKAITIRRVELGLSRNDLRDRSGLSYPYVAELEKGQKSPSTRALAAIADALDLRPHELMERAEVLADAPSTELLPPMGMAMAAPASSPRRWFGPALERELKDRNDERDRFQFLESARTPPLTEDRVREIVREELRRVLAEGLE